MNKNNKKYLTFEEWKNMTKEKSKFWNKFMIITILSTIFLMIILYILPSSNVGLKVLNALIITIIFFLFVITLVASWFQSMVDKPTKNNYKTYLKWEYREYLEQQKKKKEQEQFEKNFEAWKNEN